jgi:hypothetical protein
VRDRLDIEGFEKKALEFLIKTHELTGGREARVTSMDKVGAELGFIPEQTVAVANHFLDKRLIKLSGLGGEISLTAKGIAQVQAAQS